jgi:hypothetical protein
MIYLDFCSRIQISSVDVSTWHRLYCTHDPCVKHILSAGPSNYVYIYIYILYGPLAPGLSHGKINCRDK